MRVFTGVLNDGKVGCGVSVGVVLVDDTVDGPSGGEGSRSPGSGETAGLSSLLSGLGLLTIIEFNASS